MAQSTSASVSSTMQDKWWRVLREGEISPFKIVTVIFIRESYIHIELRRGSPEERCANLKFIYELIQSNNVSFYQFKKMLEDPKNCVRPEIVKRFNKVLQNLEEVNASFFYELVHSIIDVESSMSQMHILRKRISRSSPFGKFLRVVLLNLRKMSYPQALHSYQQLCAYLQPYIEFKKSIYGKISSGATKEKDKEEAKIKIDIPAPAIFVKKEVEDLQENIPISSSVLMDTSEANAPNASASMVLTPVATPSVAKVPSKVEKKRKQGLDIFFNLIRQRRKGDVRGMNLSIRQIYEHEKMKTRKTLSPQDETTFQEELKRKQERVTAALVKVKGLRNNWYPAPITEQKATSTSRAPTLVQHKRHRIKIIPKKTVVGKSPRKHKAVPNETEVILDGDSDYFISEDESAVDRDCLATVGKRGSRSSSAMKHTSSAEYNREQHSMPFSVSSGTNVVPLVPGSKRWEDVKHWSRKQIERTIKRLAAELYRVGSRKYTPAHISSFVEAIKHNPSAVGVLPQLHFLEYLNSLRLKDVVRCKESLRTSFDLRIKPNTSELNRGTPYAAYNFAVFYNVMGFRTDAMQFLEEAFQAGHSAADATCLQYCHNLWSIFHSKPYGDDKKNIVKEAPKHMAYLQSLNVVTSAYDHHFQGVPPEDVISGLLNRSTCDMQLIEHIRLLALSFFFCDTGWHNIVAFACQCILYSNVPWTSMAYCAALCVIAQNLLFEGDLELSVVIMDYGKKLFAWECTPAGELFFTQNSLFEALTRQLAHQPVPEHVIEAIGAVDLNEEYFWKAHNKMIEADWEESEKLLKRLSKVRKAVSNEKNELLLRGLFMRAELSCLCGKPTGALQFLFEALEFAKQTYADHFIALCSISIASVQCELGMVKLASRTLYEDFRSICRSSSPILTARFNITSVKIQIASSSNSNLSGREIDNCLVLLNEADNIYSMWNNEYRQKEINLWKSKLLHLADKEMMVDESSTSKYQVLFDPSTCII